MTDAEQYNVDPHLIPMRINVVLIGIDRFANVWWHTVYSKRNAQKIWIFFRGPPGGGGPKIHMVDYVNGSSTHAQFLSLKNLQLF